MRILAALILLPLLTTAKTSAPFAAQPAGQVAGQVVSSELYHLSSDVRIKRMHLMRPDLMCYPLLQDYYA